MCVEVAGPRKVTSRGQLALVYSLSGHYERLWSQPLVSSASLLFI